MVGSKYRYLWVIGSFFLLGCTEEQTSPVSDIQEPPVSDIEEPPVLPVTTEPKNYDLVPPLCLQYRQAIEEYARLPSRRAALMEQESSCNKFAKSFDNGEGLFQFTGATGPNLAKSLCRDLGPFQPYNPAWAIPCGIRYVESLTESDKLLDVRLGEMRYNGGYWVIWEMETARRAGLTPTLENARAFCGKVLYNGRKRASKWCPWNYDYYQHIERRLVKYED